MINKNEVYTRVSRTSGVVSELFAQLGELPDANLKTRIEARWVRSREKPDSMYCSHCFKGYYSSDLSERTLFPLDAHRYFFFCPLCGADMILDEKRVDQTPRFEDELTYYERNAGKELGCEEDDAVIEYYSRKPLYEDFYSTDEDDEDRLDEYNQDEE